MTKVTSIVKHNHSNDKNKIDYSLGGPFECNAPGILHNIYSQKDSPHGLSRRAHWPNLGHEGLPVGA